MPRLVYVLFWLVIFFIPIALTGLLPTKYRRPAHLFIYSTLARIMRIKVTVRGHISKKTPIIFTSNHMSYLDIIVLGASLPGSFVSKAEVRKWPLIGQIAKLSGTVFVSRKKSSATSQLADVEKALDNGKNLVLFPEGTTSNGKTVLNFKSSLLKVVEKREVTVQPVTLNYTHINGLPIQANERVKIAWIGDAQLLPHLLEFVNLGFVRAEVILHPPLSAKGDRKLIAEEAHKVVLSGKH